MPTTLLVALYKHVCMHKTRFDLPSHFGLSNSARPRPNELRVGVERNGVKGAGTEVRSDGTCDTVEESLATWVDADERLGKGGEFDN